MTSPRTALPQLRQDSSKPLFLLALATAAGCVAESEVMLGFDTPGDTSAYKVVADVPPRFTAKLDLLFVVDDTDGMGNPQLALGASFDQLMYHLQHTEGGDPDLRIGVISTDMGAGGWLHPGCGVGPGKGGQLQVRAVPNGACGRPRRTPWLSTADPVLGGPNYDRPLAEEFSCLANLGEQGCIYSQPLASMKAALNDHPGNAGFVRDDAVLAVVFLTDGDDCSAIDPGTFFDPSLPAAAGDALFRCYQFGTRCSGDDVDIAPGMRSDCRPNEQSDLMPGVTPYAEFLKSLKPSQTQIVVTGIMGSADLVEVKRTLDGVEQVVPSCGAPEEQTRAMPAVRLQGLLDQFDHGSEFRSICEGVPNAVRDTAQQIRRALGTVCLEGYLTDSDPERPGRQPDCLVWDVASNGDKQPISACDSPWQVEKSSNAPCYALKTGLADCGSYPTQLGIQLWRDNEAQQSDTRVIVECKVD